MGFKKRIITNKDQIPEIANVDLIDSPSRLLRFAENEGIELVPLDLKGICEKMGIELCIQSLVDPNKADISGILRKIEFPNNRMWQILVNKKHNRNRQRFTIAHEIGHYCLHRKENQIFIDQIFFRSSRGNMNDISQKMEWEANEFAASILMPREKIIEFRKNNITTLEELSLKFEVSLLAMRYQLDKLGL